MRIIHTGGGYLTTALIEYDDRGRVKSVKGEGSNQSTYNYFKDSIQLLATDFNGMDISETYYLDSKQRIVNTKFFNYNYTYNDDGYLISYKAPYGINPGQVLGFTQYNLRYENGNLVELSTPDQTVSKQKVTFEFAAPDAQSVSLAGDFTGWQQAPLPLKKHKNGIWKKSVSLPTGRYEYRLLVDGQWRDDPECAERMPNQYGGENCICVVKEAATAQTDAKSDSSRSNNVGCE